jgi:ABC-type lipoprotein release transport system permease subunit
VAGLFLGKASLIGLIGGGAGWALGTWLALRFGPDIFRVTAKAIQAEPRLGLWAMLLAPALAAVASFIPTMLAVTVDPAETLRSE